MSINDTIDESRQYALMSNFIPHESRNWSRYQDSIMEITRACFPEDMVDESALRRVFDDELSILCVADTDNPVGYALAMPLADIDPSSSISYIKEEQIPWDNVPEKEIGKSLLIAILAVHPRLWRRKIGINLMMDTYRVAKGFESFKAVYGLAVEHTSWLLFQKLGAESIKTVYDGELDGNLVFFRQDLESYELPKEFR